MVSKLWAGAVNAANGTITAHIATNRNTLFMGLASLLLLEVVVANFRRMPAGSLARAHTGLCLRVTNGGVGTRTNAARGNQRGQIFRSPRLEQNATPA